MAWVKHVGLVLITAGLLAGCGAGHELPAISEADSAIAPQEIGEAPGLRSTSRTVHQNEQIARRVVQRLQTAAQPVCAERDRNCWYSFEFSPKGIMNAHVLDNRITMYNGLARHLETEDEFATVLGHEIGHHISRHYEKKIANRTIGAVIAGAIFAGIAGATGAYDNNRYAARADMRAAMAIGTQIGHISFSKEHEREADYLSAYLMTRAGYNPDVGGKLWVKFAKASGKTTTLLFDTHPAGPDRLAAWKQAVDEVRYSGDLMPNLAGAEKEPRLQQARAFDGPGSARGGYAAGVALAARSQVPLSSVLGDTGKALEPAGHGVVGYNSGLRATPAPATAWEGGGASDGCGEKWWLKLNRLGGKLRGNLWWRGVKYDIYGKLDSWGRAQEAHAGKSAESRNMPGPRFFNLGISLDDERARGHYAIDSRNESCRTEFVLSRK